MIAPLPEPIRVCHIDSGDLWAGAEVNTTTLLKALARRPEVRLSAILLNEGEMARRLRSYGIEVKVIPESGRNFLAIFNEAARFLRGRPVSILHSHRYKENLLAALLVRRCGIPFLVSTRHGAPEPFRGWRHVKHATIGYLDRFVVRHAADRVVSLSDEMKGSLLRDLPAGKVVTIRTGIDTELVRSALTVAEAKRRLGLPEGSRVVGYAGRLVPVKRLDIFLRAAKQMAQEDPSLMFAIAGDGPEEAHLRALARDLNLEDRLRFLGYRENVYDVFRAFDVFLLCSDHEGLPRSVLEALYLGVPVVARPVGGIPEVVENGVTGVLVDSDEPSALAGACVSVMANEQRRKQVAAAGIRLVSQAFSIDGAASEMTSLYRRLGEGR
jgi:glycosyltransferase involved in cell wall biosynthesis